MADINATTQVKNNDVKIRNSMDFTGGVDMSGGQFMDMIANTISASTSDDNDVAPKQSYTVNAKNDVKYSYNDAAKSADEKPAVNTSTNTNAAANVQKANNAELKAKIQAKIKEMAAKNDTPVEDTKALKALQKVANFLLKANKDGDIKLPSAMVDKLQAFVDKGDDLKAADIGQFMSDFSDMFKQIVVALPAASATATADASQTVDEDGLKWPQDIMDSLKDLGVSSATFDPGKPLTILDVLRTVKALVNESEKAAIKTLDDKSKDALSTQDQSNIVLMGGAAVAAPAQQAPVAADPKAVATPADAAAAVQAAADAASAPVTNDDAAQKAVKDLQKAMQQVAQTGQVAAPVKDAKDNKPANPADAAAKLPSLPETKASDAVKSSPFASSVNFTDSNVAQIKSPAKTESPSLSKVSLDAQAPGQNAKANDKSFDNNDRQDSNSGYSSGDAAAQAKANLAASSATASLGDVKLADVDTSSSNSLSPAMSVNGLNGVSDGLKVAGKVAQATQTAPSLPSAATQQVIAQIQQKADKSGQITVQLTPAELGRVEVRLEIQKSGEVHTVVTADKPETLALLQKDSSHLERSLQQAGLNADAKNMSFNLRDGNQAQQFNQQGRKRFSRSDIGNDSVTEVTMTNAPEGQIFTDTRVNYHA